MKINQLEIENVKRVRAVKLAPAANGLTVIGGRNGQGKTSVLDAIAWALGGDRFRPTAAQREDSVLTPNIHIVMSNGLVVERKGKNSDLRVIDPQGNKSGQQLLNGFVEQLALDLPRFMAATDKEKADTLLRIIGVGDQLSELERQETETYNRRRAIGQVADQKAKYAKEQPYYPDAPREPVSASELIRQQQDILARNGQRMQWRREQDRIADALARTEDEIDAAEDKLRTLKMRLEELREQDRAAQKSPLEMQQESTAELEMSLAEIEAINRKVRANLDKDKAQEDAQQYSDQYDRLTHELEELRQRKTDLLTHADLPLPELTVQEGALVYKGHKWDCLSGAEQLRVATAIVRKLNPQCEFVLLDRLEQMDLDTLREFGDWLEREGLQAIATRVSTGGECSIVISDGVAETDVPEAASATPVFQKGVF